MLNEEYERRGIAPEVKLLASKVQRAFHEFQALRAERLERESLAQFEPDCDVSSRR
jgi:hypothetical protein